MTAFILAAGHATRLRPLSNELPKALFPIANVPLLDRVAAWLSSLGFSRIAVNAHHLGNSIVEHVARARYCATVSAHFEREILGTGGGVANLRRILRDDEHVLVYNADILTDLDLRRLVSEHVHARADATLALVDHAPLNHVAVDPEGRIVGLNVRDGSRLWAGAGVFVYSRAFVESLPRGFSSVIGALVSWADRKPGSVRGVAFENAFWTDVGTPSAYLDAHEAILRRGAAPCGMDAGERFRCVSRSATVAGSVELRGFVSIGEGAVIEREASLRDAVVWPGGRVRAGERCERSVVGPNVRWSEAGSA